MNLLEKEMFEVLKSLRDDYGVVGVKAEFEAEGTRIDELMRLIEIVRKLNLNLGIKIGGCEAMKDLMECKQLGTEYIIAPMVETDYALKKFIDAKNKIFNKDETSSTEFLINIETKSTLENIDNIIKECSSHETKKGIDGFVFGRVDFTLSCGLARDDINLIDNNVVTDAVLQVSKKIKENDLSLVVGGGVSLDALPILKKVREIKLDRFETRKVIFSQKALEISNLQEGMMQAVKFELLWLKNKKNYYEAIFKEDDLRIKMLSERWIK
tara:strand:- start:2574 stop:3380 length:807 start_codon:yes stop_codon:yes gene_type:complete